jgi:hypothetical protein
MSRLIRAELLKQRTTRTGLLRLLSMVALILLLIPLHVFSLSTAHLAHIDGQLKVVGWGTTVGALFAALLGAVVGLVIWLLLIETTLIGNVPSAGKFAPGAAAGAIAGAIQTQSTSDLVAPAIGVLLLVLYAAIASIGGTVFTNRRDVA